MMINDEGETTIEYPGGRTARLRSVEATEVVTDTPVPFAATLEVLEDPFPDYTAGSGLPSRAILREVSGSFFDYAALEQQSEVVTRKRGARPLPYAAELERVREDKATIITPGYDRVSTAALATKFDASPQATSEAAHAAQDALLAIVRLRAGCEQLINDGEAISAKDCDAFVEFAKQRLNVVATACPIMRGDK